MELTCTTCGQTFTPEPDETLEELGFPGVECPHCGSFNERKEEG